MTRPPFPRWAAPWLAGIGLLLATAACGSTPTAPDTTMPATTSSPSTLVFEGTIGVGESSFYSFTVSQSGTFTATLASLSLAGRAPALAVPARIGVGVPAGTGCAVSASVDTPPGLTPQFTTTLAAGIHCVNISDVGTLPGAVTFAIRFTHS
jgi:hypothetical protein